jgi:hypothetical protein
MFPQSSCCCRVGLGSPVEAEREIVEMIRTGSIHATVSQQDGMVRYGNLIRIGAPRMRFKLTFLLIRIKNQVFIKILGS